MIIRLLLIGLVASSGCDGGGGDGAVADLAPPVGDSAPVAGPMARSDSIEPTTMAELDSGERAEPAASGESDRAEQVPAAPTPAGVNEVATRPASDEASEVLLRAERAYDAVRSMRADFVQDLTVPLLASSQRSRGKIFHRKPDRFLMRFSDPEGDLVVADGRYVWLYYPSADPKQVLRTSVGEAGRLDLQREFLSNPTERFNATLDGSESVDGRPASVLTLIPRGASPYRKVRIWVDSRDGLVRRFEITETNDAVRRVELRNLEANVTLADSLFSFTPPANTQVFDQ